jgi:AcrR family transcriptional regulator
MTYRSTAGDPRVQRSHERLRDALLSLTLERGWDAISVQQVCERAGVGRSTFYAHFADREDLLLATFDSDHIVPRRTLPRTPLAFVRPLVEHVGEQRALYAALTNGSCERAVNRRFDEVVRDLVATELARVAVPNARRVTATRFLAGAFRETLIYWLEDRAPPPANEVERLLVQLSTPVLERLARPLRA